MAEARIRQEWNHTSSILAMIANVNRDPKKKSAFKPDDFTPFGKEQRDEVVHDTKLGFEMLKKTFVKS